MTGPGSVDLAIVVVTHQSADSVGGLLDSLPGALGRLRADVVVVDNASTDGTVELLTTRADCRVVRSSNVGYAAGINLGAQHTDNQLPLLMLNPDTRLGPGSVPTLLATLSEDRVGVVAPQVRNGDGTLSRSLRREPTIRRTLGLSRTGLQVFSERLDRPTDYRRARTVDWALGAALLLDRDCFAQLGGLDPSFFLFSEETDYCLRARDAGWATVYQPAAAVEHVGGASGRSARIHVMQVVNRLRLYRRRHNAVLSWLYLMVLAGNETTRTARDHGEWSRAAVVALFCPRRRPPELGCSTRIMPL